MTYCRLFMQDESGFIISSELILITTLIVIGLIGGLSTIRDQLTGELNDLADAASEMNSSYSFAGITSHGGSTAGTVFSDLNDFCEDDLGAPTGDQGLGLGFGTCTDVVGATAE